MASTNNSVGASLRAITQSGKQYNVISVKVNNRDVSPPNSDEDDDDNTNTNTNNNLYDDVEMGDNGKICLCVCLGIWKRGPGGGGLPHLLLCWRRWL